jgi:pimeloyl-ACP methyl ester carboxylesterase
MTTTVKLTGRAGRLLCAFAVSATMLMLGAGVASANDAVFCHLYTTIPVTLTSGSTDTYTIAGELCARPSELVNGETVQLLVHGSTYDHTYWDFGTVDGVSYSYAQDIAAAGYPTFAIDEVGTISTNPHPPSADVPISAAAYVAHEVVQDLLSGQITGVQFGKVIEVGHSLGSFTIWAEAATYHDVAGVIVTGAVHTFSVNAANILGTDFYPAINDPDPAFVGLKLDAGYLTTVPGTRGTLFYNAADSDSNVIAKDEKDKNVSPAAEQAGVATELQDNTAAQISVPVLTMLGGDDTLFCGPAVSGQVFSCASGQEVAAEEGPYYSAQAQLRACVVPNAGHDISLARNHLLQEADALAWSAEYVGQLGVPPLPVKVLPPDCDNS